MVGFGCGLWYFSTFDSLYSSAHQSYRCLVIHMFSNPFTFRPQSRALSDGEKQLAKSVFGDAIDLESVRLKTAWWVLSGYAVSPNGNIYFHPDDWMTDVSRETLAKRAWFIHELTHVWQVQQGKAVFWRALLNRRYRYTLRDGKSFFAYGIEQQARMVEEYYIRRETNQDCTAWQACVPFVGDGQQTTV